MIERRPPLIVIRLLALLLLLLTVGGGPTAPTREAKAAPQGIGELYLALGDSLGVGLLSSMPDTRSYVAQFHALLERSSGRTVILRNVSVSGETARSLIDGGQLAEAQAALAEARTAGWRVSPLTIDIGGNDLRTLAGADDAAREAGLADFRAALIQIFDTLIAEATADGRPRPDMIAMTIYDPAGGDPAIPRSDAWWIARFNAAISEEAAQRGIAVADVATRFAGRTRQLTWMPLDFHANNAGHGVIAAEFWRAAGYDTTAPTLEIIAPESGTLPRAVPTIKVRAADGIGVARVEFRLDDQPLPAPVYHRDLDLWIGYWDARAVAAGAHRLSISVSDAAGNTTSRELTLTR
jgi:lysophospholipase L1-like esterase